MAYFETKKSMKTKTCAAVKENQKLNSIQPVFVGNLCCMQGRESEDSTSSCEPTITDDKADELYAEAGMLVKEGVNETILEGDVFPTDNPLVRSLVQAANLPFSLDIFQHSSLCALATNKNVIL